MTLDQVCALLQNSFNWYVQADSDVGGRIVGDFASAGTLRDLLNLVSRRAGATWDASESEATIRFHD